MKQKKISRYLIFVWTILYLEVVFQILIYRNFTWGMAFGALFALPAAALLTFLTGLGPQWLNRVLTTVLIVLIEILFLAQLIYYDIFRTYLQIFSIQKGAGNALEFIEIIRLSLARSWWKVLLLLVPAAAYFAWPFWGGHADFMKETKKERWILAGTFITGHVIALLALYIPGSGLNSPFRLYNDKPVLQMCVKNLGVLTTMRRDLQRQLFNFTSSGLELSESRPEESSVPVTPAEDSSVSASSVPEESHPIQEENSVVTVPEYNTLEIDFDQLIQEAPSDTVAAMHKYFQSVEPTLKNEYTGMFEGYNLILITAESFSSWVIDQELTPMLYKMANSCFVFENFYTPYWAVSTSDGEYATHTSLIPKEDVWSYYWSGFNEMPFGLGNLFGGLGYTCYGYHNHDYDYYDRDISHPNMGYIWKGYGNGLEVEYTWPESDLEMMKLTIQEYIDKEPFHTYYLTVSGHQLYNFTGGNAMSSKHEEEVANLPYDDTAKAYLAANIELDRALEYLLEQLEEQGVADHTVIALSADHYPYGLSVEEMSDLNGSDVSVDFEMYRNSFLLYCAGMEETVTVNKLACSLDIVPTLCNLFGAPYDSRLFMGTDILSDSDPLVIFNDHSFINDKVLYNASTGEIRFLNGEYPQSYVEGLMAKVDDKFTMSTAVLDYDYYSYLGEYLPWWDGVSYGRLFQPSEVSPDSDYQSKEE